MTAQEQGGASAGKPTARRGNVVPLRAPSGQRQDLAARGQAPGRAESPGDGQAARADAAGRAGAPKQGILGQAGASAAELAEFVAERLAGRYDIDEFGFDAELTTNLVLPVLRAVYGSWFRVTVHGGEHVPPEGAALITANHSGTIPLDTAMTAVAVREQRPDRFLRILAADLVFRAPLFGAFARKTGQTLACDDDATRLLGSGELVGVFPEGFGGLGKPFSARYKLQRFGRGGFAAAAIRTGAPIVPCAIVGAEETYPKLGDLRPLARLLGLPYLPVTPLFPLLGPLGMVPLPTKWHIEFGEPIDTSAFTADDPTAELVATDQAREAIQRMLYQRLARRHGIFRDRGA